MSLDETRPKARPGGPLAWFGELDRLLSGSLTEKARLRQQGLGISAGRLTACIIVLAMTYGLCMGTYSAFGEKGPGPMQVIASMVKVPLLFYLTLVVTLPSLYVFNSLVGSRLRFGEVVRLLIASVGINVTVLASLGPIVAFFSVCTTSYPFMVVFNVAVFAVAGIFGLRFLLQTLRRLDDAAAAVPASNLPETWENAEPAGPLEPVRDRQSSDAVKLVFRIWVFVFGLVGAQMGWLLRPFIGNPHLAFAWFRPRGSNFLQAVLQALHQLLTSS